MLGLSKGVCQLLHILNSRAHSLPDALALLSIALGRRLFPEQPAVLVIV